MAAGEVAASRALGGLLCLAAPGLLAWDKRTRGGRPPALLACFCALTFSSALARMWLDVEEVAARASAWLVLLTSLYLALIAHSWTVVAVATNSGILMLPQQRRRAAVYGVLVRVALAALAVLFVLNGLVFTALLVESGEEKWAARRDVAYAVLVFIAGLISGAALTALERISDSAARGTEVELPTTTDGITIDTEAATPKTEAPPQTVSDVSPASPAPPSPREARGSLPASTASSAAATSTPSPRELCIAKQASSVHGTIKGAAAARRAWLRWVRFMSVFASLVSAAALVAANVDFIDSARPASTEPSAFRMSRWGSFACQCVLLTLTLRMAVWRPQRPADASSNRRQSVGPRVAPRSPSPRAAHFS